MALLKALCWALVIIIRIRFPPGTSLATGMPVVQAVCCDIENCLENDYDCACLKTEIFLHCNVKVLNTLIKSWLRRHAVFSQTANLRTLIDNSEYQ